MHLDIQELTKLITSRAVFQEILKEYSQAEENFISWQ